jgi:REP-associated tyrosine transposase
LGNIDDGKILLNEFGQIAKHEIYITEEIREYVTIDKFCIMPNHIHLIVSIQYPNWRGTARRAPTESFGKPISGSIPTIVRAIKSAITRKVNILNNTPGAALWQRNYYERIIRNEKELFEIRKYIDQNPINWQNDEYFLPNTT